MLRWLRWLLTDRGSEEGLRAELRASQAAEERLSRRVHVIEERLDMADQRINALGHKLARVDGRTSILSRDRVKNGEVTEAEESQDPADTRGVPSAPISGEVRRASSEDTP
ncbi:hypothetical protein [Methylobacterium oxalidis]|uniref:hypothetical protein n=1 Tax=Methylobacterium oxalidis TaxID=944322 RepID=UPI0033149022